MSNNDQEEQRPLATDRHGSDSNGADVQRKQDKRTERKINLGVAGFVISVLAFLFGAYQFYYQTNIEWDKERSRLRAVRIEMEHNRDTFQKIKLHADSMSRTIIDSLDAYGIAHDSSDKVLRYEDDQIKDVRLSEGYIHHRQKVLGLFSKLSSKKKGAAELEFNTKVFEGKDALASTYRDLYGTVEEVGQKDGYPIRETLTSTRNWVDVVNIKGYGNWIDVKNLRALEDASDDFVQSSNEVIKAIQSEENRQ